jgi:FYVE/RhoGEF/PH domain-containing protein 3
LAVNLELKTQLENRLSKWSASNVDNQVGDIFLSLSPFLRVYSLFLSNFNTSTSIVKDLLKTNQRFAAFIKQVDGLPESRNLTLNAFLMTPVQRIPRYKMLLEDLYKKTPENHADYSNLGTSIKLIAESKFNLLFNLLSSRFFCE